MKLKLLSFAFALGGMYTASAQKSFTLDEAIKFGLENNPQAKIADFDLELAKKKVFETTAMGLPQVNGSVGANHFIDIPIQVIPAESFGGPAGQYMGAQFGLDQSVSADVTVSQLIFDGSYFVGLQAAKVYVKMAQYQNQMQDVTLKHDITNAYHLLVVSNENLRLTNESLEKVTQAYNETQLLFENGFVAESAVDEIELSKLNLENAVVRAENQIKTAELLLKLQLGMDVKEDITVSTKLENLMMEKVNIDGFIPENTVEYGMVETKEKLQSLDLKNKQVKRLPSIGAFYNHQQNAFGVDFDLVSVGDDTWFPTNLVGVSLKMPIFQSGMLQSQINQSKLELQKVEEEKRQVVNGLTLQHQEAVNNLINAKKSMELVQKKLDLGESILDKAYTNHKEGLISSFELNEKESRYLQLKGEYLQAVMSVLSAQIEIQKLTTNKL